jgi:hypothetical protein
VTCTERGQARPEWEEDDTGAQLRLSPFLPARMRIYSIVCACVLPSGPRSALDLELCRGLVTAPRKPGPTLAHIRVHPLSRLPRARARAAHGRAMT